jgi:anti-anti-sigma factor
VSQIGPLHLSVEDSGATSRLRLSGEFDLAGVGRVENALDRVFQAPTARRIVFDLCRLSFLDAAGLSTILRADQRARSAAVELVVVRPRGPANRAFTLTRAGAELSMVDDFRGDHVNITDEVRRDRKCRLLNQRAFPLCFVGCSCEQGCPVCAYTGLVSRGQAKQVRS